MKKLFYVMTATAVFFTACSDNQEATLSVSPAIISAEAAGTAATFKITANAEWSISTAEGWVHVSPASGSGEASIEVLVAANTASAQRLAKIMVVAGNKTREVVVDQAGQAVPPPPEKAAISGPDSNCPEGTPTVSLSATAANAISYVWYKGSAVIPGATHTTYEVAESGTYYAAGVNAGGEGEKSPPHEVTVLADCDENGSFSIDDLVGSWMSTGKVAIYSMLLENVHYMTLTKENETTVRIANMINISAILTSTHTDEYLAVVDIENMTLTIPAGQECSPTVFDGIAEQSFLAIDRDPTDFCNNAGVDFVMPITLDANGNISIKPNSGYNYQVNGSDLAGGFVYLGYENGMCLGGDILVLDLLWVKSASAAEATPAHAPAATRTGRPSTDIRQKRQITFPPEGK